MVMPFGHVKSTVVQFSFWALTYFILLNIFSSSSTWTFIDYLYTGVFMSTLMIAVWVNAWLLIPQFLQRRRYVLYVLLMGVCIFVFACFNYLLFDHLIDYLLPGYYFISYYDIADLLKFFGACIAIATLIQLTVEWFQLQETQQSMILLEKEKVKAELQALTNQVNPHFLFNSLSVLYSLSLRESKQAPVAIMHLSEILRYVIYDAARDRVALGAEVELITNYIGLQRYRVHPSTSIEFRQDISDPAVTLMPMTFLPLIENSFKHGTQSETENAFIQMHLTSHANQIEFVIRNSKAQDVRPSEGGIGLKNIESRLNLVYGGRHIFSITETATVFCAHLKITVHP
ncbi:MAG TPA: histidine kinase [Chryseolinea sp.]|nr:histidine kinase [Chryseolinea sp.]